MTTPEPLLLSVREAARRLGIGRDTCYQLVRTGRLIHLKVGKRHLVPVSALDGFVEAEIERQKAEAK